MPAVKCAYFRCENTSQKSMFRFPQDRHRLQIWLENCGNMTITHLPPKYLRNRYLCIDHFDEKYIRNHTGHRRRLHKGAVPKHYQGFETLEREPSPTPGQSDLEVLLPKRVYGNKVLLREVRKDPNVENEDIYLNTLKRWNQPIQGDKGMPKCISSKTLIDQAKIIIARVYHYFEKEYEELKKMYDGLDLTPLSNFRKRTALATGVSESAVLEILQEEERRNVDKPQKQIRKRSSPLKRPRQADCEQAQMNNSIPVNVKVEPPDDEMNDTTEEGGFESNDVGGEQSGTSYTTEILLVKEEPLVTYNEEPEIDAELMRVDVKVESDDSEDNDQLADPLFVDVKTEPRNQETTNSNETRAVQPVTKCYKRRTRRNAEGPPGTSAPPGPSAPPGTSAPSGPSAPPGSSTTLRGMLLFEEDKIKVEEIEIKEEGFS